MVAEPVVTKALRKPRVKTVGRKASEQFQEAILIAALVRELSSEQYPLGRMRYQKMTYLIYRKSGYEVTDKFLKKASGPYSPYMQYRGPEKIARDNGYIQKTRQGNLRGFMPGDNISLIDQYFKRYGFEDSFSWAIEQLRYKSNDELELLSTIDYTMVELKAAGKQITPTSIRKFIASNPKWAPKLNRSLFSKTNIERVLDELNQYFPAIY